MCRVSRQKYLPKTAAIRSSNGNTVPVGGPDQNLIYVNLKWTSNSS